MSPPEEPAKAGPAPTPEPTRPMKSRRFAPGSLVLQDRFRIIELLAIGGMGEVYRAEQVSLGRTVAVKVLREDLGTQPGMTERFRREARLLSTVDHPSVVRVFDFGESDGTYYLVMEFVEGETLATVLRDSPLPPERALPLLRQIAEGLEVIHASGIVHRDLKAENVVLTSGPRGEQARLLDFGIARLTEPDEATASVTQAGLVLGTPEYISPEQALGRQADVRSDIYSFGVLAFRILTGRGVFVGPSPREFLVQHVSTPPPRLDEALPALAAHPQLCELVKTCLMKEPSARPQTSTDLLAAFSAPRAEAANSAVPQPSGPAGQPAGPSGAASAAAAWLLGRFQALSRRARLVLLAVLIGCAGAAVAISLFADPTLAKARMLIAEKHPAEALLLLEKQPKNPGPAVRQLRAAALHQLKRHRDEWEVLGALGRHDFAKPEPLALAGLCEDFAEDDGEGPVRAVLGRLPESATGPLLTLARGPVSKTQWGALRALELTRAKGVEKVPLYIRSLASEDCNVLATAAERLGELGDKSAVEPLEALKSRPRKAGFLFFQKSCGHDEAATALRKLAPGGR